MSSRRSVVLLLPTVLAVLLSLGAPTVGVSADALTAQAGSPGAGYQPKPGAVFNLPRGGDEQFRIHKQIVAAIDHAHRGSYIRIALFSFDRNFVASALVGAHRRGVHVQVLLNDHQVTPAQLMLHRELGRDRTRKSFAYECHKGCRSRGENLHTKMYLFSHTGRARDVVMTGSSNLTMNSALNQYNDLWIKNDNARLHGAFVELFESMRADRWQKPAYWVRTIPPRYKLRATPYPNFGPHHDPIMSMLDKVHCAGATHGTGNSLHHTVVRVVMHAWNDDRGHYLAKEMRRLYAKGCDVKAMYGFAGASVRDTFADRTARGYLPVHTTGYDTDYDGFLDLYTHQKELLIDGHYGGDTSTRLVVTGSSNWNPEGLRGDEEIFSIKSSGTYGEYISNFRFLWTYRSHLVRYIPYRLVAGRVALDTQPRRFGPAWENG